jgi:hypothetical protein
MVAFERPVGASADVKELEYISSLHQTAEKVRTDGSIKGKGLIERRLPVLYISKPHPISHIFD